MGNAASGPRHSFEIVQLGTWTALSLIRDRTYFAAERAGALVGFGGWSYRRTLYGGVDVG